LKIKTIFRYNVETDKLVKISENIVELPKKLQDLIEFWEKLEENCYYV